MERCLAIVEDGLVTNIIVVNPNDTKTLEHFGGLLLPEGSSVAIGHAYDGLGFRAPVQPAPAARGLSDLEQLKEALLAKGVITKADIDAVAAKAVK